jgi:glucan-binding YG repeat protein
MIVMKGKMKIWLFWMLLVLGVTGSVVGASAAETESVQEDTVVKGSAGAARSSSKRGWVKEGKYRFYYSSTGKMAVGWRKIGRNAYYFREQAEGKAPVGSRVTGFQKIGKYTYYFNKNGVLLTGWQKINGQAYYLKKNGSFGTMGRMHVGFNKIGGKWYYFKPEGAAATGWTKIKKKLYYFSKSSKLVTRGSAYTGWKKIGKYRYYFSSKGLRYTSRWIDKKYYVDKNGRMLVSCITPDGYIVNASGVRGKLANGWVKSDGHYYYYKSGKKSTGWTLVKGKYYYLDADGVRQVGWQTINGATYYLKKYRMTGWKTISGKLYYFDSDGKMAVNTVLDGYTIGPDGVAVKTPREGISVLLIAGHGQGDVGAFGVYGKTTLYEYLYTREFATLIYNALNAVGGNLKVTMYDQNYDCYQVLSGKKVGPVPVLTDYDYVLEVHFNATVEASKDSKGDGKQKGTGMYVNSEKKDYKIDRDIIAAIANQTGFKVWGGGAGIFASSGLFNAKTCQQKGVSYGLLETAFIDDRDDMEFYNNHKNAMAQAVAGAIRDYFAS